ncbi:MAG: UDP-glucose/GDP-mannose dehydrogenase family protein [Candidatus Cloacimonetes bacterium]|nr:UDP-glucose/GDP-mannose dehydrogenase family protein [Candidatus Cloacimonadota bacterium]
MNLTVIGSGYVGLVTGTCFAEMGNRVICVDNNEEKINMLNQGKIPIYEPGLEEMLMRNSKEGRLSFTTDLPDAVKKSLVCFIAVGTPPDEDGSADLSHVLTVARDIAQYMDEYKIIVDKSTVPVGTADLVAGEMKKILSQRNIDVEFDVVSNPEFLKEGNAIEDFMKPDRVVIGTDSIKVAELMNILYSPFNRTNDRVITMSIRSAEMTKYAANAMLATKISFMNEIARLCELTGADIAEVRHGIGSDTRIGYKFIYPGVGYGGSCFPKDVKALINMGKQQQLDLQILQAVEDVNERQKRVLAKKVKKHFGENLSGKTFAIWGLAFKPQTDDMREAPSIVIINMLLDAGATIRAYDPVALEEAKKVFHEREGISFFADEYQVLDGADALLLITEWHQFRYPDFEKIKKLLKNPVIFDGRNQYNHQKMKEMGFIHYSIGRTDKT